MPELPSQICSYILADKSCYAYGTDEIHEMSEMRKTQLAEESSDKRNWHTIRTSLRIWKMPSGSDRNLVHQVLSNDSKNLVPKYGIPEI